MIRVMIVDDSRMVRRILREILESDPEVRVIEEAEDGAEAVEKCVALGPDVVLMDIQMPVMDGLQAVEAIMRERPTPVIILSATVSPGEVKSAFRAVRAGAFEALAKPEGVTSPRVYAAVAADLLARVKLYARVGRRKGWGAEEMEAPQLRMPAASPRVVGIGASTGGPRTVQAILSALPPAFPCPILVVQHISLGFTRGFASWLQRETNREVKIVERSERLVKGSVYLATDGNHLEVRGGMAVLTQVPPVNACRPSVDVLFSSLAREYGSYAVAVLLTGMGRDGANGAAAVRGAGGEVVVQDEESCVVFGMPKAAIDLGAASRVVPARLVPRTLAEIVGPGGAEAAKERIA
ncbi:MAG: chemotaxis-specific protein-glutamate methyltransferase CheB [Deltaproteobacteria bacterium]|nr:chemotaxis-specific protein-glutamate methyltransferase CheB [Deltaproteobacteria bacterium]